MKPAAFTALLMLSASATHAQFSLQPQAGLERSSLKMEQNGNLKFEPSDGNRTSLRLGIRADYRLKGSHGPYLAIGTAPATVNLEFNDPVSAWQSNNANFGRNTWRMEAGYQYIFKPFALEKQKPQVNTSVKRHCGSSRKTAPPHQPFKPLGLSIRPSFGVAYTTGSENFKTGALYQYTTSYTGFSMMPAVSFDLVKGKTGIISLQVQHTRSLGKSDQQHYQTISNGKTEITQLSSSLRSWSVSLLDFR